MISNGIVYILKNLCVWKIKYFDVDLRKKMCDFKLSPVRTGLKANRLIITSDEVRN
jgi:hypothetical protein